MKVDLHVHTTASDGRLSPAQIIGLASKLGLRTIAITDHDSIDGVAPALAAAKEFPRLQVIPGVEINTDIPHGEVHVLGYFVDIAHTELKDTLKHLRDTRESRALIMIARLKDMGMEITWERVRELAGKGSVGRPHIAQALLEKGHIGSFKEAFDKYIGRDGPAYADREKLPPDDAVRLIERAGGLPVLAHPWETPDTEKFVVQLRAAGLIGMEVYYAGYDDGKVSTLLNMAHKYGLIPTGGTDYHAFGEPGEFMLGSVNVPYEIVGRLMALETLRSAKRAAH